MVFQSVPVYLDPPNWLHQQPNHHHHQGTGGGEHTQLPPLPSAVHVGGGESGGGAGSIRPGSMADRARLANIPQQPEAPLKCPRCDSANTKFCYFNNYSLSQPRHFCKTCRRYWTRGGALRNVPVGGGCRRNKKSKSSSSSSSKSAANNNNNEKSQMGSSNSTTTLPSEIMGHHLQQQQAPHQITSMASLHNLSQYNIMPNIGLNFGAVQQFPFFEQHAPNTGFYSFQNQGNNEASSSLVGGDNQLHNMEQAPVKMEDHRGINLSRPFLGISENNQFWSGNNNWTDLSGLNNSSSTNHIL